MLIFRLHFHHEGLECEKKIFWDVFSGMAWYVSMKNFRFHSTALQFLCNKCHILIIFGEKIFFLKNICSFTPVIKISSKSDQKWAKTRHLLLKMFKTPKCLLLPHCAMAENEGSWEHFRFFTISLIFLNRKWSISVRDALRDQNACFFIMFINGGGVKPVYKNFGESMVCYEKGEKRRKKAEKKQKKSRVFTLSDVRITL